MVVRPRLGALVALVALLAQTLSASAAVPRTATTRGSTTAATAAATATPYPPQTATISVTPSVTPTSTGTVATTQTATNGVLATPSATSIPSSLASPLASDTPTPFTTASVGLSPVDTPAQATARPGSRPAVSRASVSRSAFLLAATSPSAGPLDTFYSTAGQVSDSVDGLGTLADSGTVRVAKPVGATVRAAFLLAASTGFSNYQIPDGDVEIDGAPITWSTTIPSAIGSYNSLADVTSLVRSKIDSASPGLIYFTINELHTALVDGEILAVVFNDPSQPSNNSVSLLFGAQNVTGDTFKVGFAHPIVTSDPHFLLTMSLGISFGYQANGTQQYSTVDVNGQRLTTAAGGEDDQQGADGNGALLTVGGIGDSIANPPDPYATPTNPRSDDELYDLRPFVKTGDTSMSVFTRNPSNDDNIFFAAFSANPPATVTNGSGTQMSGTIPWHPHHNVRLAEGLSASVDLADGHIDVSASDMHIPARGPDLPMDHTWDSTLAAKGVTSTAGAGWTTSLSPQLGGDPTGVMVYTDTTGATWPFTYTAPAAASSLTAQANATTAASATASYETTPGLPWRLTTTGTGYALTDVLSDEMLTFDAQGRYLSDTDSYGNSNHLLYTGDAPTSEANSGGRTLSFAYQNDLLAEARSPLWDASNGVQGQHVTYGYTGNQLTHLTWGAGTTDALTATFGYSGTELTTITTPYTQAAHTWTINYDGQGRVTSIVSPPRDGDASGAPTDASVFFYNSDGSGSQIVDGANTTSPLTTTYTVDSQGEPITVTDGLNHSTSYTYDSDHDVLSTTDANDHTTTNAYAYVGSSGPSGLGSIGLVTQTVKPSIAGTDISGQVQGAVVLSKAYDPTTYDHDLVSSTSGVGALTLYGYNGHHAVITTTQEVAATLEDTGGRCVQTETCPTQITWRATVDQYDANGERVAHIDGRGLGEESTQQRLGGAIPLPTFTPNAAQEAQYTTRYTYTPQGDLASQSTPPITTTVGATTRFGPVTTTSQYDGDGNTVGETSANHNTTTDAYDHLGHQVSTTLPAVVLWDGSTVSPTSLTQYDGEGNVVRTVNANGAATTTRYDPLGRQVAETNPVSGTALITYSATEKVAEQAPGSGPTTYAYDAAGQRVQTTDPTGGITAQAYDNVGNTTAITTGSAAGPLQVEAKGYDAWNQVVTDTVSGPGSTPQTTRTGYDADGNVTDVEQPNGDVTLTSYDQANEQVDTAVLPSLAAAQAGDSGSREQYTYDDAGNVVSYLDMDQRDALTTYNAANRVIETTTSYTGANTLDTRTDYDPNGNIQSETSVTQTVRGPATATITTATVANQYNADDWLTSTTESGSQHPSLTTSYAYDALGQERRRVALSPESDAAATETTFDAEGRAIAIGDTSATSAVMGYTADDLPFTMTLPNGVRTQDGYDPSDRLTRIAATGALSDTYAYGYDPLGRTTGVTSTVNGSTSVRAIAHDATSRITGVSGSTPTDGASIGYDGNGNITAITATATGLLTRYAYGSTPNELVGVTTGVAGGPSSTMTYGYDGHGDTTGITSTSGITTLTYDSQARLSTVRLVNGTTVAQDYNSDGERASYTVRAGRHTILSETFAYQDGLMSHATVVSGTIRYVDTYLYTQGNLPLELVRQTPGHTDRYWYTLNGHGDVVALTNAKGQVVDRYSYDVWGAPTGATETVPQPFRYAGYWWDKEVGWYWVSVRSYDPVLKRWLQSDPSEIDGVRTYVYAGDDPVDVVDLSGLSCYGSFNTPWGRVNVPIPDGVCGSPVQTVVNGSTALANGAYNAIIQPDLDVLHSNAPLWQKALAGADLVATFLPPAKVLTAGRLTYKFVSRTLWATTRGHVSEAVIRATYNVLRGGAKVAACALCFPAGTLVATPHGVHAIQTLKVGDLVLSENPSDGKVEAEPVEAVIGDPVSPLIAVNLSDGTRITVTVDHPFWVDFGTSEHYGEWIEAGQLWRGARLRTASGTQVPVSDLQRGVGHAAVYTLTVAKDHTFFVGSDRVLVHNSSGTKCRKVVRGLWRISSKFVDHSFNLGAFKYMHDTVTDLWWSKDLAGHNSVWKVYRQVGNELRWEADADEYGTFIVGKHKSMVGLIVKIP